MSDFGTRLIQRLEKAKGRNQVALENNQMAKERIVKALPILEKDLQGNQIVLAALREIYSVLEADGEELQSVYAELKIACDSLETATNLLEQAGFDFANIQTFSNDEIWLGNHLPTIKRALDVFNISLFEQALDDLEKERFEDIAHAVQRSGQKRNDT